MDEKKLEQVQDLEDQQLDDVNGGSRTLKACDGANDEARVLTDDEELDGRRLRPIGPALPF